MNPAHIKQLRTQSLLKELIPEAFAQMGNPVLHELIVLDVTLSKGRSDAKVYLDPMGLSPQEEQVMLGHLKKARIAIEEYIKNDQGWFRSPQLTFIFDRQLEQSNSIEALLAKVEQELHAKKD
ncbi:MAG: ribosome-binding factor A [Sulfurovum sp. PC08-66]|nr:MAG: ribosome-binding factor A [Sulfurovum sp. PC08-66]KIM12401.1 MAG: ribosome-binding factor A [Sulfuricurvum sp. PC08-66]